MANLRPLDQHTKTQLNEQLKKIEGILNADVLAIVSPILPGLENSVKAAIEMFREKRPSIAIVLETPGGIVEIVERMVSVIRHHYSDVVFVIADRAMSAGTVFVMAGDRIYMNYFSCLGPIDPQIEKEDKLVPAMSYLAQFQRLSAKAERGELNTAEFALLSKLDLGELYQFEQARELSIDLLVKWLSTYKFKDWSTHGDTAAVVADEQKRARAKEVAAALSDNARWHSHGRAISRSALISDPSLRLKIEKMEDTPGLELAVDEYVALLKDYISRSQFSSFIHTREFF